MPSTQIKGWKVVEQAPGRKKGSISEKVISQIFTCESAADAFCDLAKKSGKEAIKRAHYIVERD